MLIHERFVFNSLNAPKAPCLIWGNKVHTYRDVLQRANGVSAYLETHGVQAGDVVALIAERGPEFIWSVLGVSRLGAVFVVLDASYPAARVTSLLQLIKPRAVLYCGAGVSAKQDICHDAPLSTDVSGLAAADWQPSQSGNADAPAYYLFTSGSTGTPKCVVSGHAPLMNFVGWHTETFGFTKADRFSLLSGLSHDPILRDIFTPLSLGASLVIPQQSDITEPGALNRFMQRAGITVCHLTPPMGQLMLARKPGAPALKKLRHLFWGGDQLLPGFVADMRAIAPHARSVNFYGSTETPQAAAYYVCPDVLSGDRLPIGQGTRGFQVLIADAAGNAVSQGETGEIIIKSDFLSLGYVQDGQIVAPEDRYGRYEGERCYRTGDLGFVNEAGQVVAIGRSDDQIKIRGYRVDLSEVTAALRANAQLAQGIALAIGDGAARRIEAFVVQKTVRENGVEQLRREFAGVLPPYMMPSKFWLLDVMPLLPNGKVDREALRTLAETSEPMTSVSASAVTDERVLRLMADWGKLLGRRDVGPQSTFNGLGGDSLSYVGAYLAVEEVAGTVPDEWQSMPIETIVARKAPKKNPYFANIDSTIVIRAVSMVLLVAYHASLSKLGNGITAGLFLVSGFLFARTQWDNMFSRERIFRLLTPLKSLLPPIIFFTYLSLAGRAGNRHDLPIYNFFLSSDLFDHLDTAPAGDAIYWYVHDLIKLIGLTFLLQWLVVTVAPQLKNKLLFVVCITVIFAVCRLALPLLFLPNPVNLWKLGMSVFQEGPLANMSLFYLGIVLSQVKADWQKVAVALVGFLFAVADVPFFNTMNGVSIAVGIVLMLWVPKLPVPRILSGIIYQIAAASIYIYLCHYMVFKISNHLQDEFGLDANLSHWLKLATGIVAGILIMYAFDWGRRLFGKVTENITFLPGGRQTAKVVSDI